jgi:hypothetical protein
MKSEKQLFLGDKNRGYNSKSPWVFISWDGKIYIPYDTVLSFFYSYLKNFHNVDFVWNWTEFLKPKLLEKWENIWTNPVLIRQGTFFLFDRTRV